LIAGASVDGAWTGYTFLEGSRKSRIRLLRFHRAGQADIIAFLKLL